MPRRPKDLMTLTSAGATVAMHRERLTPQQQSTLVERIRRREAPAEEELVHLFSDRVAFLVRTRTRDPEAARDLTQEVLLAVVLALRSGHLREAERLTAFVYGTARNVINNYLRTRSRLPREDPIDDDLHPANSSQDPFEDTERAAFVRNALGVLDSIDRRILLLTLVEGLKPGEIAAHLGLTSEVVRTRKSRALKKAIEQVKKLSRR
jgi:RNA polymerase sigma-70 factor (ECF subfamily)